MFLLLVILHRIAIYYLKPVPHGWLATVLCLDGVRTQPFVVVVTGRISWEDGREGKRAVGREKIMEYGI